jgi:hypothetical protein
MGWSAPCLNYEAFLSMRRPPSWRRHQLWDWCRWQPNTDFLHSQSTQEHIWSSSRGRGGRRGGACTHAPSPAQQQAAPLPLLPPRRASTRCSTLPPSMLYSLAILSSFIALPAKISLQVSRDGRGGGPAVGRWSRARRHAAGLPCSQQATQPPPTPTSAARVEFPPSPPPAP